MGEVKLKEKRVVWAIRSSIGVGSRAGRLQVRWIRSIKPLIKADGFSIKFLKLTSLYER